MIDGRYRLASRLGAGGMSVVWRAHDEVLGRDVAVKVLSPDLAANPDTLRRIRLEARAAAQLRHPHVVEVHDYGETTDGDGKPLPYVVMELVEGRSLAQLLTAGALPWRLAVLVGAQVAAALAAAHARGIVHRDVTPNNVMVTASGVKLVDFGISATVGEADSSAEGILGTPAYLAPERLDAGQVRPATDVYALGLLLYRMLAGRLPWAAGTTTQMLIAHRYTEPEPLPTVAELPEAVVDLCRRCLTKKPGGRPAAGEAADLLGEAVGLGTVPTLSGALDSAPAPAGLDLSTVLHPLTVPTEATPAVQSAVPARRVAASALAFGRRRRVLVAAGTFTAVTATAAVVWAGSLSGPEPGDTAVAAAAGPVADLRCTVRYAVRSATAGRSATAVTVLNTGAAPAGAWTLRFALAEGQRLTRGWSADWRQDGRTVQVSGTGLTPGREVRTGFDADYRGVNALPAQFRVNGTLCTAELSMAGVTTPSARPVVRRVTPPRTGGQAAADQKAERVVKEVAKKAKAKPGKAKGKHKGPGKG
ncbi:serine/threonine-protein kinase [Jidongwangia harbinensis]|uniref:serine/threonine-protein kinase n=1 Tax=Jidongwangia harbinensis TaxID=2878561 RepID=UPI001CD925B2|nr:serine/threonine-protein kinase [Jidongwangia harbinensis]MCA2213224.1 protein kinase [Jidongwangia harbinensis]